MTHSNKKQQQQHWKLIFQTKLETKRKGEEVANLTFFLQWKKIYFVSELSFTLTIGREAKAPSSSNTADSWLMHFSASEHSVDSFGLPVDQAYPLKLIVMMLSPRLNMVV
jgi:hypothetical protein